MIYNVLIQKSIVQQFKHYWFKIGVSLSVFVIFSGCQQMETNMESVNSLDTDSGSAFLTNDWKSINARAIDGVLHFSDTSKYLDDLQSILSMSEGEFEIWEKRAGFQSMATLIIHAHEEFGKLQTESDLKNWKEKYKGIVELRDSVVTDLITDRLYTRLSNTEGEFYIGDAYTKVTPAKAVTILDGDKSKLDRLGDLKATDREKGIIVNTFEPLVILPTSCGITRHLAGTRAEKDKRRAFITFDIRSATNPSFTQTWTWIEVQVYGHIKNFFGWNKYKTRHHADNVRFKIMANGITFPIGTSGGSFYDSDVEETVGYFTPINIPDHKHPSQYVLPDRFLAARGRNVTQGTENVYSVICCGAEGGSCPLEIDSSPF